jgi:hypothetical protein
MGEKKSYTCPNAACKKVFTVPLKTLNLQESPSESYFACPICLTRIQSTETEHREKIIVTSKVNMEKVVEKQPSIKENEKPTSCQFHMGYLSERTKKEIPENCLVCKEIVTCMLKKFHEK